jgi:uncharacterized protein (TIGR02271 family)
MSTYTLDDVRNWSGKTVHGSDGNKIGKVDHVYLDRETGEPSFLAIKTGLFGMKSTLAPVDGVRSDGDDLRADYTADKVKDAPNVDPDEELSEQEEQRLYSHYGRQHSAYEGEDRTEQYGGYGRFSSGEGRDLRGGDTGTTGTAGTAGTTGTTGTTGHDTSGPTTDDAMTRSEEELKVGKAERESGRARLRKYVVTEDVQQTVPVTREEVRVEREPITEANRGSALDGPAISEEEHEVVLHEEEPVVEKQAVPKERVRLEKDAVTDEVEVNEELRKERIETDGTDRIDR